MEYNYLNYGDKLIKVNGDRIYYYNDLPNEGTCVVVGQISYDEMRRGYESDLDCTADSWVKVNGLFCNVYSLIDGVTMGYIKVISDTGIAFLAIKRKKKVRLLHILPFCALFTLVCAGSILAYNVFYESAAKNSDVQAGIVVSDDVYNYTGDELYKSADTVDITPSSKGTIIDGIVYEGDYLSVNNGDYIPLGCNPENEGIYFNFKVVEGDDVIYNASAINPGECARWYPAKSLTPGIYDVTVIIDVFDQSSNVQYVGSNLVIKIRVL